MGVHEESFLECGGSTPLSFFFEMRRLDAVFFSPNRNTAAYRKRKKAASSRRTPKKR